MTFPFATPDCLAQVVHLYLAVAETAGGAREPHERQLAIDLSRRWAPSFGRGAVEAVVDTAYAAARSGLSPRTQEIAEELCQDLPPSACQRLLIDLGLIARADGHLSRHKAETIARVRAAFRTAKGPEAATP